jgi:hypothetical protein
MPRARIRSAICLIVLATAAGCATTPPESASPSAEASGQSGTSFLPPGCGQSDYRDPQGAILDLSGQWVLYPVDGPFDPPAAGDTKDSEWIRQAGDCVWGVTFYLPGPDMTDPQPDSVVWYGTLGSDFVIDVNQIHITSTDPTELYRSYRLRIDFAAAGYPGLCPAEVADCFESGPDNWVELRPADLR